MTTPNDGLQSVPSSGQIADLKRLSAGIIRAQGNRFIKELLRSKGIRIGANKDEFDNNLTDAIETGRLVLADIDGWLEKVEGWGDQHVYLYQMPQTLRSSLTESYIHQRVQTANLNDVWNGETILEFPDTPKLTSISFTDSVLRIIWQEASPGWTPVPDKNTVKVEGLDTFEYRAWRKVERRAITRFEAHLDKGLAGLFIANPIQTSEHQAAIDEAKQVIGLLIDLPALEIGVIDISEVSRNLDQQNVPTNDRPEPEVKTQKSRLSSGGAYVEFAANSRDKAYWEEPAIQDVRSSVRNQQLPQFNGAEGVFVFQEGSESESLSRPLRVQLYGKDNRIRLWAQMDSVEVWTILSKIKSYLTAPDAI
jgi:hypothetical protein